MLDAKWYVSISRFLWVLTGKLDGFNLEVEAFNPWFSCF
jgi:hypothetical protein